MTAADQELRKLENLYIFWCSTEEKTKEIEYKIEDVDLKITFQRGIIFYPLTNSDKLETTHNKFYVCSINPNIQKIFEDYFPQVRAQDEIRRAKHYLDKTFALRFFVNKEVMENTIQEEEKEYSHFRKKRWSGGSKFLGSIVTCCVGRAED